MLLQETDIWRLVAEIAAIVLGFLKPYILPIGEWMIIWINFLLEFFPTDSLMIYFAIFVFMIIIGAIVNSVWPGDKPSAIYEKKGERIDDSVETCSECGKPTGGAKICPYCGNVK